MKVPTLSCRLTQHKKVFPDTLKHSLLNMLLLHTVVFPFKPDLLICLKVLTSSLHLFTYSHHLTPHHDSVSFFPFFKLCSLYMSDCVYDSIITQFLLTSSHTKYMLSNLFTTKIKTDRIRELGIQNIRFNSTSLVTIRLIHR